MGPDAEGAAGEHEHAAGEGEQAGGEHEAGEHHEGPEHHAGAGEMAAGPGGDAPATTTAGGEPPAIQRLASGDASPAVSQATADRVASPGSGSPLPDSARSFFEPRFQQDFSGVRVHTDVEAAHSAKDLQAQAFTVGRDIHFGAGQYDPGSNAGKHLIAHELTHVVQQGGATRGGGGEKGPAISGGVDRHVQRGFWGSIKKGIKAIGRGISKAANWVAGGIKEAGAWVVGRLRDAGMWLVNLVRDLPARLVRLVVTLWDGLVGIVSFLPELIMQVVKHGFSGLGDWLWEKVKAGGAWVVKLLTRILDLVGFPEIAEFLMHLFAHIRRLSGPETTAAKSVLGASAIRYGDVRVASGGWLNIVFKHNNARAFTTFHTLNMPPGETLDVFVHELTHVYQYERTGSFYIAEALHAQGTTAGYNYGGAAGLVAAKAAHKPYRGFNREQQAQIAQDYYNLVIVGGGASLSTDERAAYDHYIGELRAGQL
jgi:Domain of unknown function (DUF4157)